MRGGAQLYGLTRRVLTLAVGIQVVIAVALLWRPTAFEQAEKECAAQADEQALNIFQPWILWPGEVPPDPDPDRYESIWYRRFQECMWAKNPTGEQVPQ